MTKIGERKREEAHVAYYRVMNEIEVAHSYIVMHAAEERKGEKEMTKVYTRREKKGGDTLGSLTESWR